GTREYPQVSTAGDISDRLNWLGDKLAAILERVDRMAEARTDGNSVGNITLHAGGAGVWIAATCCAVMMAVVLIGAPVLAVAYLDMRAEVRALKDTDNAIRAYINTGALKPAEQPEPEQDE